jgi:hypothetical protein
MKLKIISDGTVAGTYVVSDKGEKLQGVEYICWEMDFVNKTKNLVVQLKSDASVVLEGESDRPITEKS